MEDGFIPILENNEVLFGLLIAAPISVIFGAIVSRFGGYSERELLEDEKNRDAAIAEYRVGGYPAYFRRLERISAFVDWFYGEKYISGRSFGRCLQLAFLYPPFFLLIGWAIFETANLGGLPLFAQEDARIRRILIFLSTLSFVTVTSVIIIFFEEIRGKLKLLIPNERLEESQLVVIHSYTVVLIAFLASLALGFSNYVDGEGETLALVYSLVFFFTLTAVTSAPTTLRIVFSGATGTIFFVLVMLAFQSTSVAGGIFLFLLFLPIFNALADTFSLAFTRYFLDQIRSKEPGLGLILWDLLLDLMAAVFCLVFLLASLALALDLWAWLAPDTLAFDWREYIGAVRADWTQGTALYLMLFTTLIPTLVHVIAGLGAVLTHKSRMMHAAADVLEAHSVEDKVQTNKALTKLRWATFYGYGLAAFLILGGAFLVFEIGKYAVLALT